MNRRTVLKFLGLIPAAPALASSLLEPVVNDLELPFDDMVTFTGCEVTHLNKNFNTGLADLEAIFHFHMPENETIFENGFNIPGANTGSIVLNRLKMSEFPWLLKCELGSTITMQVSHSAMRSLPTYWLTNKDIYVVIDRS